MQVKDLQGQLVALGLSKSGRNKVGICELAFIVFITQAELIARLEAAKSGQSPDPR